LSRPAFHRWSKGLFAYDDFALRLLRF
jgi:hypothetical protein